MAVHGRFRNKERRGANMVANKRLRLRATGLALAGGLVAALAPAGTTGALAESLSAAARRAVQTHPDVKALRANRRAIGEELNAARGLALPGVRVEGGYGLYHDRDDTHGRGDISIKLRQPLYDGGKYYNERRRQEERVGSADGRVADTVETIALQAVQAYLEVVRARRVVSRSRKNLRDVKRIVSRVRARVRGGAGTQADLAQARSRLLAARTSLTSSQIQRDDAMALYLTVVGRKPGKLQQADLPTKRLPRSVDALVRQARNASPKLLAIRHDAAAAAYAVGTARAVLRPKLDLELSANHGDRLGRLSDRRQDARAMVRMSLNVYNGGIDRARIREAIEREAEATHLVGSAVLSVERELRLAWNTYRGSRRKVAQLLDQSRTNERLTRLRLQQYDGGQATLISILDAQNEAFVAGVQATNEFNAGRFAFYKMLAASGRLASTLGLN